MIVESEGGASDLSIFSLFSYQFIKGDPKTALDNPHSIVMTESTARKYIGDEDPMGKVLRLDNTYNFQVTCVIKDLPPNSYSKFDFLVPFVFLKELGNNITGTPFYPYSYLTYVLLKNHVDIAILSNKNSNRKSC